MKLLITAILALFLSMTADAQSVCPSTDPNRLAAVLTGGSRTGYANFLIDSKTKTLHYRLDAAPGRISRGNNAVVSLDRREGSVPVAATLLEELSSNPSAFTVSVGGLSGALNGRGSIVLTGELSIPSGSSGRIRTDRAANATGVFTLTFVDDEPSANDVRVDFDVMTDSIADFDGSTLVLVGADGFAQDILDMGTADGFIDGRVHGSVRLSRVELEQLLADQKGYSLQLRSPADGTFSGDVGQAVSTFVPAFGRASNGRFASDLRLYNPGDEPVNVFIQFYPNGSTNALAGHASVVRLEPGQSRTIADAAHTLLGQSSGLGSLRVVAGAQVVVDSEIGSGSHNAAFGQFVSGVSGCSAVTQGVLTGLSANAAQRTNVLIGNPGARRAFAHFMLRDGQGNAIDTAMLNLGVHEQMLMPLTSLFPNAGSNLRNAVLTMHADTPLFLGASLIQNGTNEARFSVARDVGRPLTLD